VSRWLTYLSTIAEDVIPVGHARIAAAIVYKNELISVGVCSYKSHPLQKHYGRNPHSIYLHAEVDALIKARSRIEARGISLKKCTLYIARVKRASSSDASFIPGLAKPCEGCMKAIHEAGLTNIIFTEG
jgi:deoxycytidylate deaminase